MILHPWHEVAIEKTPSDICYGIIKIPGIQAKYEIDKERCLNESDRETMPSGNAAIDYEITLQTVFSKIIRHWKTKGYD